LKIFGEISFLDDYVKSSHFYLNKSDDTLEQALPIWRCFVKHSFENPIKIYYPIFTEKIGSNSESLFKKHYQLFPEELENISEK